MIDYQKSLNKEQYRVVTQADGPCLVLAGAGSGKTRTLVYRVAYLLQQKIDPQNILLVTFTNKAAKEMMGRVEKLLGFEPIGLNGGTFHAMGNKILRQFASFLKVQNNFGILDQEDSISLVKQIMELRNIDSKGRSFPKPAVIQSVISYANNCGQDVLEVAENNFGYPEFISRQMELIFYDYQQKKQACNVMDFDDLLVQWLKLLQNNEEVAQKLSKQFKYILVDEYQDTNFIQAQIIKKLAEFHRNVLVVGDDSQSIYSFRAADVNNILNFPKDFKDAKVYRIETNYRSTPQILSLANNSIEHNKNKFEKKLQAVRDDGVMPILVPARDVYQQSKLIVSRIVELRQKGVDFDNIAILFRASFQAAELQLELAKHNIAYVVRGGMRYFEQAHIKDIVAYLKILANVKDELAWRRILIKQEGIGQSTVDFLWQKINQVTSLVDLLQKGIKTKSGKANNSWLKLIDLFDSLNQINIQEKGFIAKVISNIMKRGYEEYLKLNFDNYKDRLEDINQFIDFVVGYEKLDDLLSDVMLSEQFATASENKKDVIVLSTIHQAKGLEWMYVIIIGLRDGDFPHYKSLEDQRQLEEERRLFYVATTRARNELTMMFPVRKFSYQFGETTSGPSLFVKELDDDKYIVVSGFEMSKASDDFWQEDVISYD